ncbi:MAG: hypothetical protein R3C99_20875 [Pirellulaceae bacterium]
MELPGGAVVCLPAGDERSLAQVIRLLTAFAGADGMLTLSAAVKIHVCVCVCVADRSAEGI